MGLFDGKICVKNCNIVAEADEEISHTKRGGTEKHPGEWITELESLRNNIDNIRLSTRMMDQDFMSHILKKK